VTDDSSSPAPRPAFAHASEAELARILDFYDVRWEYEPDTFPIGWSLDGEVVESFSPDFYLPDLELYVELTTLKQSLVRKKNRKLRRLRELYPDVRIKLFYARDFRMLLLKFGRLALAEELTGTTGQATPPRISAHEPRVGVGDALSAVARAGPGAAGASGTRATSRPGGPSGAVAEPPAAAGAGPAAGRPFAATEPSPRLLAGDAEAGRTPRGRRRGRRRRAATRALALGAPDHGPGGSRDSGGVRRAGAAP
jgi:hypothetical protein